MPWVKLSDTFADDPRLEEAGAEALAVHIAGLCYCARQLTDGRITDRTARRLWSLPDIGEAITQLVKVGLWREVDGNYEIVDYLDDQPDAETVRRQQQLKAERQRRWLDRKRGGDASQDASGDGAPAPPRPAPKGGVRGGEASRAQGGAPASRLEGEKEQPRATCPTHWLELPCRGCAADSKVRGEDKEQTPMPTKTHAGWKAVENIAVALSIAPDYSDDDETGTVQEITAQTERLGLAFVSFAAVNDTAVWIYLTPTDEKAWPEDEPLPDERFQIRAIEQDHTAHRYTPADALAITHHYIAATEMRS